MCENVFYLFYLTIPTKKKSLAVAILQSALHKFNTGSLGKI